jgi:hypothetical protein
VRVLVCGSRTWDDPAVVHEVLFGLTATIGDDPEFVVIEGECPYGGADLHAAEWAQMFDYDLERYPADWDRHGKAAGPIRNQQMLDEGKPDVVWAFKDDFPDSDRLPHARGGTEDMVRRAKRAGVPVYVVSRV